MNPISIPPSRDPVGPVWIATYFVSRHKIVTHLAFEVYT